MDYLAIALEQSRGDYGTDPLLLGLLDNSGVPGIQGIALSYLLLRRELGKDPAKVQASFRLYRDQFEKWLSRIQNEALLDASNKAQAREILQTLAVTDEAITSLTKSIPIIGQIVDGVLKITDLFVQAYAQAKAVGKDSLFGGLIFAPGQPVFWGWRRGIGPGRLNEPSQTIDQAGYWMWDVPVWSFQAPIWAGRFNAKAPEFSKANNAVSQLAVAFPYGMPEPVKIVAVFTDGVADVRSTADRVDLQLTPIGKVIETYYGRPDIKIEPFVSPEILTDLPISVPQAKISLAEFNKVLEGNTGIVPPHLRNKIEEIEDDVNETPKEDKPRTVPGWLALGLLWLVSRGERN